MNSRNGRMLMALNVLLTSVVVAGMAVTQSRAAAAERRFHLRCQRSPRFLPRAPRLPDAVCAIQNMYLIPSWMMRLSPAVDVIRPNVAVPIVPPG